MKPLNATITIQGTTLKAKISGIIDENSDLKKLFGPQVTEMEIECGEIFRINSAGIRNWIEYFKGVRMHGTRVTFKDCAPILVQQINMITNFMLAKEIESIRVPFECDHCQTEFTAPYRVTDLVEKSGEVSGQKCLKCGKEARFDDIKEEYFLFLERMN